MALLSLDRLYDHLLQTNARLTSSLSAKTRTGYALRTLLADPETISYVTELATVFSKTQRSPIVLQLPSPMQWLTRTHHFAGTTDAATLDADDADNASMYVADWLRSFAALGLAGVLLDDRTPDGGVEPAVVGLDSYSPIANVTEHYGWTLGLRRDEGITLHGAGAAGGIIRSEFWLESDHPLPAGDFLLGEIPPAAVPEEVLTRILSMA